MKNKIIYLDYAATTPVDPRVAEKMWPYLTEHFGNPASAHHYGRVAKTAVEQARQQMADLIQADPKEIIWTSGATEANNLAIKGVAYSYQNKGRHLITSQIEHESVIESCRQLEREGFTVTYLMPEKNGLLDLAKLEQALCPDTILVSIMQVNNEIGIIQDIAAISEWVRKKGAIFHVDAAQSLGKMVIDVTKLAVDLMSFSGHKIYGPKGIGALYINRRLSLQSQIQGGGQEQGFRSGTLATHQIVGMGEACAILNNFDYQSITQLRDQLWAGLQKLGDVYLNGDLDHNVPHILNVAFKGIDNNVLLPALRDIALSTGAACHSNSDEPSRVLRALGLSDDWARSSLRFSLGRFTTTEEIETVLDRLRAVMSVLRG